MSDLVDGYYETTGSLLDTHLSLTSNRLNDVMRMLTLIATIFMPLSFIAGLYGMDFDTRSPWTMPELAWRFGYPAVLIVMTLIAMAMIVYFRRRRWLQQLSSGASGATAGRDMNPSHVARWALECGVLTGELPFFTIAVSETPA